MTKRQLDKILKDHKLWLEDETKGKRANLFEANLSGANLSRVDLSGAYLVKADLTDANLYKANLSGANLDRVDLSESNLIGANLSKAYLYKADLSKANLLRANLYRAYLSDTLIKSFCLGKDFGYMWKNDKDKIIIKIGCEEHESKEFIKKAKEIGAKHGYTDKDIKLYTKVVKLLIKEM